MSKYIFAIPKQVSAGGIHVLSFQANVPREVPERFVSAVVAAGGYPAERVTAETKLETPAPKATDEASITAVAEAMIEIVALDDKSKITGSGMPRANEVEKLLGRATTRPERDAAWAMVEA